MEGLRLPARRIALVLIVALLNQVITPTLALALTSGPTQPEVSSFAPAGTSDMVDLFSGDFQYNIPLLDVGGYPVNISYTAGPGMDEEASWVGLGWNLNPGVINRQMRGLPDDFSGDSISKTFSMRPDVTTGITLGGGIEIKGIPLGLNASVGMYYNTYRGYGLQYGTSPTLAIGNSEKSCLTAGLGLSYDSQNGLNISPSLGFSQAGGKIRNQLNFSTTINSQRGLRDLSISYNASEKYNYMGKITRVEETGFHDFAGGSTSISLNGSTYTPTSELPLKNSAFTFHGTVGGEYVVVNPHASVEGYQSTQKLAQNQQKQSSFGYLHSQLAKTYDLMDFNRERQGLPWREHMPVLPPGFGTYDLFLASGQGCSGQFRAVRNDVGYFQDAFHENQSDSKSLGVELGLGNAFKAGVDFNFTKVDAFSQGWKENNALIRANQFSDWDGKSTYEPVFFKNAGEPNITDLNEPFLTTVGSTSPIQGELDKKTGAVLPSFQLSSNQKPSGKKTFSSGTNLKRPSREKRNDIWQYLNGREANWYGLEKQIVSYKRNQLRISDEDYTCAVDSSLDRRRYGARHISETTVIKPDGSRYVYGIPAYNTYQKEVSFSAAENAMEDSTGMMIYDSTIDNSIKNRRGRDWYYNSEAIPPYPYAFLLTAVLSPDYIDRTGNGVTNDDYGTAIRINYSKMNRLFRWRTPYGKGTAQVNAVARYQPGRKSDLKDNKASYTYGTKEVWYVHSIESATMVAQFYTSNRQDGLGVLTENGGIDLDSMSRLQRLDSIKLFSKADLLSGVADAVAIKTVHFEYDYSLCPKAPNSTASGQGKLTLKKIWFTYGKSGRGVLNAYTFSYNDRPNLTSGADSTKYAYNMAFTDRWGNYKVNPSEYPDNSHYPYSLQDESLVFGGTPTESKINQFAGAWSLRKITLPSGGSIEVQYEADDYAYVQDKRAGQMYFVKGFSRLSAPMTIDSFLYTGTSEANMSRYVWIDLDAMHLPNSTIPDTNAFKTKCLESVDNIWFHMDVKLSGETREDITGYMQYDRRYALQTGSVADGNITAVGIPIKIVETDNGKPINPIVKAALQTMRLELPDLVYPGAQAESGFEALIKSMIGLAGTIKSIFNGFEVAKMKDNKAKYAGATIKGLFSSWVRLCNPRYKKFGGGHRVKQITLTDNWNNMTGKPTASYGQRYTYTTEQKIKIGAVEQTLTISSGVAAWEPTIGNEENLWKQPVNFNDKIKLAPDNSYYVETPFGESLFPAAMIGYSEVKAQNIGYASNARVGAGWTVNKYYTFRDFPTRVDYSAPLRFHDKGHKLLRIFKLMSKDYLHLTQGFTVEVNDMHGKMKQESAYGQNGSLISQTNYDYKVDNPSARPLHLKNVVKVVTPDGAIGGEKQLGMDVEVWNDFREEVTTTKGAGLAANTDGFYAWIPLILFTAKMILQKEDVRFRSAVTTKYVKRYGVLDKVTKMQGGSTITTENLLWDSETGGVLATKTQNEFEDPIYQFTYPVHWVYDGMGLAYKNANTRFIELYFEDGIPYFAPGGTNPFSSYTQYIAEGDEFAAFRHPIRWAANFLTTPPRLTVYKVPGGILRFYDENGLLFDPGGASYDLILLRSGRRNMQSTPLGSIVSKANPSDYASIHDFLNDTDDNKIVNATANTFRDLWQKDCVCTGGFPPTSDTINPYRNGMKGNWRLENTYVNHRSRLASAPVAGVSFTDIRNDGTNQDFAPFWDYISGQWQLNPTNDSGWVRQSGATIYDFKGNQNEEQDALGIYSMAQYGYQGNLNTAVAHNTRFQQGMFEGFEDYNYSLLAGCEDIRGCDFKDPGFFNSNLGEDTTSTASASDSIAHTGRFSYRISQYGIFGLVLSLDTLSNALILDTIAADPNVYVVGPNACRPSFKPTPGTYLVSAWVNTGGACFGAESGPRINIFQSGGSPSLQSVFASGPVIDGWQRIYGKVEVTASAGTFRFQLQNSLVYPVYFDDIRFHPWLGNMKSFVYDPVSLRLMATLDENNYATFYEYDDEGMLIRVKRETERGVMTVEENRSSLQH